MMGIINRSNNWAISGGAAFGCVPIAGITACALTLFDVDDQMFYPAILGGSSIGAGLKLGGTVSTFSPTFFTVAKPMFATDFDNSLCGLFDTSLVIGVGGGATFLNIYGVEHSPSILDLTGISAGVGAGITLSPLMYLYVSEKYRTKNTGCRIDKISNCTPQTQSDQENQSKSPKDPANYSKAAPNQSKPAQ